MFRLFSALEPGDGVVPVANGGTAATTSSGAAAMLTGDVTLDAYRLTTRTFNAQTGMIYTIQASDNGKLVTFSSTAPVTVTLPTGLGAGFSCAVMQVGEGLVTFNPVGTMLSAYNGSVALAGRYAAATLFSLSSDSFVLAGNLT